LLARKIEPWELRFLFRSYEVVGDIAIIRVPKLLGHGVHDIAEAVMGINKHVKTVLCQVSPVSGDYRLRELSWVAGEKKTETVHKEHGCIFRVDLARCYFSPRLLYERRRIAEGVERDGVVVNMFSGVGCYSIVIAKHSEVRKVYSIDVNPVGIGFQRQNVRLNRVEDIVKPIIGDAGTVIRRRLRNVADRVLMALPEKAFEYMDYAMMALRPGSGWVHYYDLVRAGKDEDPIRKVADRVSGKMVDLDLDFEIPFSRVVRTVGPRRFQVVLDMLVGQRIFIRRDRTLT
jgi:tRNA (guanine37-N1)-methyltransferase